MIFLNTNHDLTVIECNEVNKSFPSRQGKIEVLRGIDLKIDRGKFVVITGRSGAGKTTLLNILGALDGPTSGKVSFYGKQYDKMTKAEMISLRRGLMGIIFQELNLIGSWTAVENVEAALSAMNLPRREKSEKARFVLEIVGLSDRLTYFPNELSAGERQRVAVARTLACNPKLILADEPTGNVDPETGSNIIELLVQYIRSDNATLVLATHGNIPLRTVDSTLRLENGALLAIS